MIWYMGRENYFPCELFMMTLIHTKRNSVCYRVTLSLLSSITHKQNPADVESASGQVTSSWKESYRWALPSPPQKSLTLGRATNSATWNLACLLRCFSCLKTTGTSFYSGHFLTFLWDRMGMNLLPFQWEMSA